MQQKGFTERDGELHLVVGMLSGEAKWMAWVLVRRQRNRIQVSSLRQAGSGPKKIKWRHQSFSKQVWIKSLF